MEGSRRLPLHAQHARLGGKQAGAASTFVALATGQVSPTLQQWQQRWHILAVHRHLRIEVGGAHRLRQPLLVDPGQALQVCIIGKRVEEEAGPCQEGRTSASLLLQRALLVDPGQALYTASVAKV